MSAPEQYDNVYDLIEKSVAPEHLAAVQKCLFGGVTQDIPIAADAQEIATKGDFEIRSFALPRARAEERRAPRVVRVAAIQHPIYESTSDSILKQYKSIEQHVERMIDAAAAQGANIICLQEAWTCPFFFCTRERYPWLEFAESAEHGDSIKFVQRKAKQLNVVIITSILEIDHNHADTIWNTAVVVSNGGHLIGKTRKYHIPTVGDFNESSYYFEGNLGQSVFETEFGRIGVNICYGRHFPQHWNMLALNGAEIIVNPSATTDGLSEPLWGVEARNAAIANSVFTVGINRVGSETFPHEYTSGDTKPAHKTFGHFYGSSYVAGPTGQRTPALSRTKAGVLVAEIDLNLSRQVRNTWGFQIRARADDYVKMYTEQQKVDYQLPIIRDPMLDDPSKQQRK